MAEIVGAFGVPHTPTTPQQVRVEGHESETGQLFRAVQAHLEAVNPDVLVVFDSDHLNTFFLDNLPLLSVGVADQTSGPNDDTEMPRYVVPVAGALAAYIRAHGIGEGFDLAVTQEFEIDHSILVPLHFLTPSMRVPIVPIFVSGLLPPRPLASRCLALGEMVRRAVATWPGQQRVAILASGSFSLDIGGVLAPGHRFAGMADPAWSQAVVEHLRAGRVQDLVAQATEARLTAAGNAAGELLNWIALLGAIGTRTPILVEPQPNEGHAFAAWRWD